MADKGTFRSRLAGALLAGAAAALIAVPAAGAGLFPGAPSGSCSDGTTSHPFASWLDFASYELAPNGGFESGATGWTLTGGAQIVSGNEPYYANGAGDSHSLSLAAGASATSGAVCIGGPTRPTMRFFAASGGPFGATLTVQIRARGLGGILLGAFDGGSFSVSPGWRPTPIILALQLPTGTSNAQIVLTSTGGTVLADDVFIDPWLTH